MKNLLILTLLFLSFQVSAQSLKDSLYMQPGDTWAFQLPTPETMEADSIEIIFEHMLETFVFKVDTCHNFNDIKNSRIEYGCMVKLLYPNYGYADSLFIFVEDVFHLRGRKITSQSNNLTDYTKQKDNDR